MFANPPPTPLFLLILASPIGDQWTKAASMMVTIVWNWPVSAKVEAVAAVEGTAVVKAPAKPLTAVMARNSFIDFIKV